MSLLESGVVFLMSERGQLFKSLILHNYGLHIGLAGGGGSTALG